jgi:hypothetical protein
MIEKAESARDQNKVKNMVDCMANESSWRLSENFERNCKERGDFNLDEDVHISLDMQSYTEDPCIECEVNNKEN